MYDLIIKNARILDGTGTPHFFSDLAVKDGKIALVAKNIKAQSAETIDANGLYLTPGFIDSHSHYDLFLELYHEGANNLTQGITTTVTGMCGQSPMPAGLGHEADLARVCETVGVHDITLDYDKRSTFKAYFDDISKIPIGHNAAFLVGHGSLRAAVMGYDNNKPTDEQMSKMKDIMREFMENGALGISFGLIYPPSSYADIEEMETLCAVAAEYGGLFTVHLRNEADKLIESVTDMIGISERTGARLVLSHHKSIFKQNWGQLKKTVALIDEAAQRGVDVFYDVYPYTASSTTLGRFIPESLHALGIDEMLKKLSDPASRAEIKSNLLKGRDPAEFFSDTMVGSSVTHPEYVGKFLPDIAKEAQKDAFEVLFDLLVSDRNTSNGIYFRMCEEDIETAICGARGMVGTDGLYSPRSQGPHPRAFGTFTRYLGHYVRDRRLLSLPEAIRKITSTPAAVYGLTTKGILREGFDADMVLFNPDTIIDKADYVNPKQSGEGIKYVFVGGKITVCDNNYIEGTYYGKGIKSKIAK